MKMDNKKLMVKLQELKDNYLYENPDELESNLKDLMLSVELEDKEIPLTNLGIVQLAENLESALIKTGNPYSVRDMKFLKGLIIKEFII